MNKKRDSAAKNSQEPASGLRLERRRLLKAITALPAAALAAGSAAAAAQNWNVSSGGEADATAGASAGAAATRVFSPHEFETVKVLSDWIIPADQRSGSASQAGVPEFVEQWLASDYYDLLPQIRGGITWLDLEANRLGGHDFKDSLAAHQKQLLDRIAFPQTSAPEDTAAVAFFSQFRDLVVNGFFTSKMGIQDLPYVGNEPQPEWHGCPDEVLAKLGFESKARG